MTFLPLKLAPHSPKLKNNLAILKNDDHDLMEEAWCHFLVSLSFVLTRFANFSLPKFIDFLASTIFGD
jgi:hypothetical protein